MNSINNSIHSSNQEQGCLTWGFRAALSPYKCCPWPSQLLLWLCNIKTPLLLSNVIYLSPFPMLGRHLNQSPPLLLMRGQQLQRQCKKTETESSQTLARSNWKDYDVTWMAMAKKTCSHCISRSVSNSKGPIISQPRIRTHNLSVSTVSFFLHWTKIAYVCSV